MEIGTKVRKRSGGVKTFVSEIHSLMERVNGWAMKGLSWSLSSGP